MNISGLAMPSLAFSDKQRTKTTLKRNTKSTAAASANEPSTSKVTNYQVPKVSRCLDDQLYVN